MQVVIDEVLTSYQTINPKAKKACVVLHGWAHKGEMWRNVCEDLDKNYRYYLLDLPGFGGSEFLKKKETDVDDYSDFVKKFMRKTRIKKAVFLGHSFGGQIATDMAIKEKGLVKALMLVAPASIRKRTLKQKVKVCVFSGFSFLKKIIPPVLLDKIYKLISTSDYHKASDKHKEILKKITRYDQSRRIGEIECPSLIIWGERDRSIPFMGKFLVEKIKKSRLRVIYGAGHNLHLEKAEELGLIINKFLKNGSTFN